MSSFQTLWDFPQFRDGLQIGVVVAIVAVGIGWSTRPRRRGFRAPWGLAGPAWVVASLGALGGWWGFAGVVELPKVLLWGLVILFVSGEIAERTPNPKIIGIILGFPGALLVAFSYEFEGPGWIRWLVLGVAAVGGPLAADLDRRAARLGLGPVLWLIAVAGLYWTVPDTERARCLIGVAFPIALTGWPLRATRMGAGGISASIGLFMWVAAIEGRGRPGSIVGAGASIGLFLVEPVGRMLAKHRIAPLSRKLSVGAFELWVVGAQIAVTGYASRVVGFAATGAAATWLVLPAIPVGIAIGGLLGVSKRLRPRSSPTSAVRRIATPSDAKVRRSQRPRGSQ